MDISALVIEDRAIWRDLFRRLLLAGPPDLRPVAISCVGSVEAAVAALKAMPFDLVLLDLGLTDSFGIDTFFAVFPHCAGATLIVVTGEEHTAFRIEIMSALARFIPKSDIRTGRIFDALREDIERGRAAADPRAMARIMELLARELVNLEDLKRKIGTREAEGDGDEGGE